MLVCAGDTTPANTAIDRIYEPYGQDQTPVTYILMHLIEDCCTGGHSLLCVQINSLKFSNLQCLQYLLCLFSTSIVINYFIYQQFHGLHVNMHITRKLGRYNKGFHFMTKLLEVMVLPTLYKAVYILSFVEGAS